MRVSDAVVGRLAANGIDAVFGIPGTQTLPLNEGIADRDDIRFVMARHETAVTHQAWGYAETSGRPAATLVVPGPGDLNAANGLKNAFNDCAPLLHLAVETDPALRGGDAIHETPPGTYDPLVKANFLVETPAAAAATVDRAISIARTHPRGPVRVGIPKGFLSREIATVEAGAYDRDGVSAVPETAVGEAVDLLAAASRPVILAGGGVRAADASGTLREVAGILDAPVVTTYKGKGTVPEDDPRSAGVLCGASSPELVGCLADADAALAVGTDLDAVATGTWSVDLPAALVHVTVHENDLGTGYEPAVGIVADADATLRAITDRLDDERRGWDGAERARSIRAADADRLRDLRTATEPPLPSVAALAAVRDGLPRDAVVSLDAGGFRIWALVSFPAHGPRSYVNPGSWATMGTGLPAAIGAAVAHPDRGAVAITGDGGLMMCLHELHTIVAESIPVTVVVFNNSDYAIISEEAARGFGFDEAAYGWTDAPISFPSIAAGVGLDATRAATPDEIEDAVAAAVATDAPRLVEVPTDPLEPQAMEFMAG